MDLPASSVFYWADANTEMERCPSTPGSESIRRRYPCNVLSAPPRASVVAAEALVVFSQGAGSLQRRTDSSPPAEVHPDHRPPAAAPIILAAEGVAVQTNIGKAHYPQSGLHTERTPKQTLYHELGAPSVLVPNHAVPVAHLLPYEQNTSSSNGPMFAEGAHLCFVPSVVCPQWVRWEAQQQHQQNQQHQQHQHHHQQQHQCPLVPKAQQEQKQRRRQLVAMAACSRLRERKFDAAPRDDMAACALKRKFDAFVMCDYTPRHPSTLPTRRWVSINQLYHLIRPHAPMDVWLKGPGNLKQLIADWYKGDPAFVGLGPDAWIKRLKSAGPSGRGRSEYQFCFEHTPRGAREFCLICAACAPEKEQRCRHGCRRAVQTV